MKRRLDFSTPPETVVRASFFPSALALSRTASTRSRIMARREVRFRAIYVGFTPTTDRAVIRAGIILSYFSSSSSAFASFRSAVSKPSANQSYTGHRRSRASPALP